MDKIYKCSCHDSVLSRPWISPPEQWKGAMIRSKHNQKQSANGSRSDRFLPKPKDIKKINTNPRLQFTKNETKYPSRDSFNSYFTVYLSLRSYNSSWWQHYTTTTKLAFFALRYNVTVLAVRHDLIQFLYIYSTGAQGVARIRTTSTFLSWYTLR